METFINDIIGKMGYVHFLHLKDFILFLFGVCIGSILICFLSGYFIFTITKLEHLERTVMIKFIKDSKPLYFANPKNIKEAVHLMAILIFSPFGRKKQFTLRDIERTRKVIIFLIVITIILFILALFLVFTSILPFENGYRN